MWFKRIIGLIVSSLFLFNCVFFYAGALERQTYEGSSQDIMLCASGQFSVMIPGKKIVGAVMDFSLDAGERVTINASYFPTNASVDFGLVDSEGIFHYVSASNGTVNQTIRISERGRYTLAIRNNSSYTVNVSGFVTY